MWGFSRVFFSPEFRLFWHPRGSFSSFVWIRWENFRVYVLKISVEETETQVGWWKRTYSYNRHGISQGVLSPNLAVWGNLMGQSLEICLNLFEKVLGVYVCCCFFFIPFLKSWKWQEMRYFFSIKWSFCRNSVFLAASWVIREIRLNPLQKC